MLILGNHLPDEEDKESRETPKVRKRMGGKSCMHAYPTNVAGVNLSDGLLKGFFFHYRNGCRVVLTLRK